MNSVYDVFCDNNCLYPIEHLFKAVTVLEGISEVNKDRERLEKKLHKYLMKASKEIDGIRYFQSMKYYPTGLLKWNGYELILEGFTTDYEPPEPELKQEGENDIDAEVKRVADSRKKAKSRKTPPDTGLRTTHLLWYAQLRQYKNRRYVINEKDKFHLDNIMKKHEIYSTLDEQERKLLDKSHGFKQDFEQIGKNLFYALISPMTNGCQYYNADELTSNNFCLPFLFDDELDDLDKTCELAYEKYKVHLNKRYHWNRALSTFIDDEMEDFTASLDLNREGRTIINLKGAVQTERIPYKIHRYDYSINQSIEETKYRYEPSFAGVIQRVKEEVLKIEDERALTVLEKFGIKFEKPEENQQEEEQPEQIVV